MKSEQVKQRKAQRLNYLLQLANAYFAAASLCVCFLGLMYDADISYTLTLVLPWTAVFCVLIGIWLYNRRTLLCGCAVAALAALAILMLDPLRSYIRGFIGWIPENLLYIRMPFDRIYTPFCANRVYIFDHGADNRASGKAQAAGAGKLCGRGRVRGILLLYLP